MALGSFQVPHCMIDCLLGCLCIHGKVSRLYLVHCPKVRIQRDVRFRGSSLGQSLKSGSTVTWSRESSPSSQECHLLAEICYSLRFQFPCPNNSSCWWGFGSTGIHTLLAGWECKFGPQLQKIIWHCLITLNLHLSSGFTLWHIP